MREGPRTKLVSTGLRVHINCIFTIFTEKDLARSVKHKINLVWPYIELHAVTYSYRWFTCGYVELEVDGYVQLGRCKTRNNRIPLIDRN